MELYEALTLRRKAIKMSFEELCNRSGISISTLKKIFTGVTTNPAYETVRIIANAMGITTDDLTDMMDGKPANRLSSEALELARRYDALDKWGKQAIDAVMRVETERCAGLSVEDILDAADAARRITG